MFKISSYTHGLIRMCSNLSRPRELICSSGVSADNTSRRKGLVRRTLVAVPGSPRVNPELSFDSVSNLKVHQVVTHNQEYKQTLFFMKIKQNLQQ